MTDTSRTTSSPGRVDVTCHYGALISMQNTAHDVAELRS